MPQYPARFYGKVVAKGLALVDSGAKYCVIHHFIRRFMMRLDANEVCMEKDERRWDVSSVCSGNRGG